MKGRIFNVACNLLGLIALCCQGAGLWGKGWQVTKFVYEFEMSKEPLAVQQMYQKIVPFPIPPMNISMTVNKGIWSVDFVIGYRMLDEEFKFTVNVKDVEAIQKMVEKYTKQYMTPPGMPTSTSAPTASQTTDQKSGSEFMDSFGKSMTNLHALATIAIIPGLLGAAMFALCFRFKSKNTGVKRVEFCVICWILSALLVSIAVILGLQDRSCLKIEFLDALSKTEAPPGLLNMKDSLHVNLQFPWATFMSGIGASCSVLISGILMLHLCMKPNSLSEKGTTQLTPQYKDSNFRQLMLHLSEKGTIHLTPQNKCSKFRLLDEEDSS